MKKKRIFYSIEVECEDEDTFDFIRLHNPKGFDYEYVEDIKEPELHPIMQDIFDCFNPVENAKLLEDCKIKTIK